MKKILQLCVLLLAVTLLGACQPTPSEEVVVNKRETDLYSESEQADIGAYDAPATWSETIENGEVTYSIDATVEVPDVTKYPIIEVEPTYFDYDVLDSIVQKIVPNGTMCIEDTKLMTKASYQDEINMRLNGIKNVDTNHTDFSEEQKAAYIEQLQQEIESLMDLYNAAPDKPPSMPISSLAEMRNQSGEYIRSVNVYSEDGSANYQLFLSDPTSDPREATFRTGFCGSYDVAQAAYVPQVKRIGTFNDLNDERIEEVATAMIQRIGLADEFIFNAIVQMKGDPIGEAAEFTKTYLGIPETYAVPLNDVTQTEYGVSWTTERIEVYLDEGYNVRFIRWNFPSAMGNTVKENVALLSFEQVQGIVRDTLQYYVPDFPLWEGVQHRTLVIERMVLGMMRVKVVDSADDYVLIPVWDCFGYFIDHYASQDTSEYVLDQNYNVKIDEPGGVGSFFTINAIDGSIIDRRLGY
jgi:hypothetical protein